MSAREIQPVSQLNRILISTEAAAKDYLIAELDVSRETLAALERYEILLKKWASQINLIGPSTLDHFWQRHVLDCAQLLPLTKPGLKRFADFGTGAGLPGLILARLLADKAADSEGILIESSAKRCGFLREAARTLGVSVAIVQEKIEVVTPTKVDLVTARAFAPLEKLLAYAYPWSRLGADLIFFKGEDVQSEIDQASTNWSFQASVTKSITDSRGCLLEILDLAPR
jgi:16S rRNA (guanine527-N7)-methyltransferase